MSLSYFPLFPDDFEADTAHLTLAEDGAYNRLLRLCWRTPGCSIPADREWIYRRMRAITDDDKRVIDVVIDEFFVEVKQRLSNARLVREYESATEKHERRKNAGKKGGLSKPLKTKKTGSSNAKAMHKQPEPEPEPEPLLFANAHKAREPDRFEEFWKAYPKREGPNSKQAARKSWKKVLGEKHNPQDIIDGVKRYRRELEEADEIGTRFVCMASTYLNQERWLDDQKSSDEWDESSGMSYWEWKQSREENTREQA
jgi:uncharacterized protein YdaU (DUF1376 family)